MNLNLGVFTSKYVIKNNSTITYVEHDPNGDWQFLSNEPVQEEDAMIVSISQLIEFDPTIEGILELPKGHEARRVSIGSEWKISTSSADF